MIVAAPQTNPSWNLGSCTKLSISVRKCREVPGRHREMGTALDHRAGQVSLFYHLPWPISSIMLSGSTTLPFIHPAVLRVFDHTNVQGTLLSSLGSSGANSLGLCRQVMTTDQARHAGLIVLIRWGILGNAMLRLIDLFCVQYQSWHRSHIATLVNIGVLKFLSTTRLLSFNWQNRWNCIIHNNKWRWWMMGTRHYDDINKGTSVSNGTSIVTVQSEIVC